MIATTLLLTLVTTLPAEDPPEKAPTPRAKPLTVYRWKSKNDLRFTWATPKGYDGKTPRNLTVICHGTGLDYRWGHWNNKPEVFRPDDIVVSVDGPSPGANSTRLFLGKSQDAKAMHAFLGELRQEFKIDRIFLYGHSQGGFFVVYYAGEYPADVAGVVAHASGHWGWSKTGKPVKKVAISFMHGTMDPVVPYRQSVGSRDQYAKQSFPMLNLRRLSRYNHWPNGVRASEEVAWCDGMTTSQPEQALAAAEWILKPKPADEYQWQTVVGAAGARAVLRRLVDDGHKPFSDVAPAVRKKAKTLIQELEKAGAAHVKALAAAVGKSVGSAKLNGKPWLGHIVALREDFRGVDTVEAFVKAIGYDAARKKHLKATKAIFDAWYSRKKDDGKLVRAVLKTLPKVFLYEGLPPQLGKRMRELEKAPKQLKLSKKERAAFKTFENWDKGWRDGLKAYAKIWKKWK